MGLLRSRGHPDWVDTDEAECLLDDRVGVVPQILEQQNQDVVLAEPLQVALDLCRVAASVEVVEVPRLTLLASLGLQANCVLERRLLPPICTRYDQLEYARPIGFRSRMMIWVLGRAR